MRMYFVNDTIVRWFGQIQSQDLADFTQSQAKTKVDCSQHTKKMPAGPLTISFPPYGAIVRCYHIM
jgi:hypothetical protein